mmetsp:Transcript_21951/g.65673  ORF Transcript_21951/g.65673 Transcript_21951/m.65673 type:complete len:233 (+) Transcript_21951:2336-3034(+)
MLASRLPSHVLPPSIATRIQVSLDSPRACVSSLGHAVRLCLSVGPQVLKRPDDSVGAQRADSGDSRHPILWDGDFHRHVRRGHRHGGRSRWLWGGCGKLLHWHGRHRRSRAAHDRRPVGHHRDGGRGRCRRRGHGHAEGHHRRCQRQDCARREPERDVQGGVWPGHRVGNTQWRSCERLAKLCAMDPSVSSATPAPHARRGTIPGRGADHPTEVRCGFCQLSNRCAARCHAA